jgi:hypothetical protein
MDLASLLNGRADPFARSEPFTTSPESPRQRSCIRALSRSRVQGASFRASFMSRHAAKTVRGDLGREHPRGTTFPGPTSQRRPRIPVRACTLTAQEALFLV